MKTTTRTYWRACSTPGAGNLRISSGLVTLMVGSLIESYSPQNYFLIFALPWQAAPPADRRHTSAVSGNAGRQEYLMTARSSFDRIRRGWL